jgi:hypothetical protein
MIEPPLTAAAILAAIMACPAVAVAAQAGSPKGPTIAVCQFDNPHEVRAGDWVVASSREAGDCHDAGGVEPPDALGKAVRLKDFVWPAPGIGVPPILFAPIEDIPK